MESQSVKIDRYLEELEIHRTPNKIDLTPSSYPKRFSPIPNSLDVDLKDKEENIPYISTSLETVSRDLIQDNFSENNNTSRNYNKPHSQPIDSSIDSLIEGEETVLSAATVTSALLETGSDATLVRSGIANYLKLDGVTQNLRIVNAVLNQKPLQSILVSFEIYSDSQPDLLLLQMHG